MAKFLATGLQVVHDCLVFPEQICAVKGRTIQVKLYFGSYDVDGDNSPFIVFTIVSWRLPCLHLDLSRGYVHGFTSSMRHLELWWK